VNHDSGAEQNSPETQTANVATGPSEISIVLHALRFALVSVVLFLSYFPLRLILWIPAFRRIMADMLEGSALPAVSKFAFGNEKLLLFLSLLLPAAALATLFWKNIRKSFYTLALITFLALIHFAVLFESLWSPLTRLTDQLGPH
jgi:hypothetical protein